MWQDEFGKLYTARDSGCSCPTPFDSLSLETLERLDVEALRLELGSELINKFSYLKQEDAQRFLQTVEAAVNATRRKA